MQELFTSYDDLHYESYLHQTPMSDRWPTKEAMQSRLPRAFTTVLSNFGWWLVCWWITSQLYSTPETANQCQSLGSTIEPTTSSSLSNQALTWAHRAFGSFEKKTEGSTSQSPSEHTRTLLPKSRTKLTVITTYDSRSRNTWRKT